ncbi:MAG: hypothetical protein LIP10_12975 [Clostridiales bacterium]|nr:hypothetical protein [Clostridiales bacterium]
MQKELTAKELAVVYDGALVDVTREDTYGVSMDLRRAKIVYDEDFEELSFEGEGYSVCFNEFEDSPFESITYDDAEQETCIEFSEYMPPLTIRRSDSYMKHLKAELEKEG